MAFKGKDIKEITIPDTVKIIGKSAFPYAKTIKSISIPPTVTTIGALAFMRTSARLESVIIPESVISTCAGFGSLEDDAL